MSDEVPPEELQPHPKNAEIYGEGDLAERFIEDVRENGVVEPVAVTADSWFTDDGTLTLISGHRRRAAAAKTGHEVPIGERLAFDSADEELDTVLRYNDQREKTFSQRMGEADAIREVEHRAAADRQGERTDLVETLPEGESGRSRDEIADRIGAWSGRTYQKARKVWDAAKDDHPVAAELVEALDGGDESIHSAYTTLRDIEEFSTNDRLAVLLDELVADGQLSDEDVRRLKATNPESVIGWLSAEHDVLPVADGTVEGWEWGSVGNDHAQVLEYAKVPAEAIRSDWVESLFGRDQKGRVDNELLGLVTRLYKDSPPGEPFAVAPTTNGEFQFLERGRLMHFMACELVGVDQVPVLVLAVDGTDHDVVEGYISARWITDTEHERAPTSDEDFDRAVQRLEDTDKQALLRRIRSHTHEAYSPPRNDGTVIVPGNE